MLRNLLKTQRQEDAAEAPRSQTNWSMQVVLWALWTLAVATVGYLSWHADVAAQRPINMLGLVIHCVLAGLIGLVIMTKVEMHLEPWRFFDE